MSYKKLLPHIIGVMLVILFLVGCGGTASTPAVEAPAVTSEPEQAAATPISEPPTATPVPPTPTPQPVSNLSKGTALVLGGLEADVSDVEETATLPGLNLQAQSGMKFVVVKLKVKKFQGNFNAESLALETAAGKQYTVTGGMAMNADGTEITIGFEVPEDENLDMLTLSYE
jgi:hypothetical protein